MIMELKESAMTIKLPEEECMFFNDELFINIGKIIAYFSLDLEINH